MGLAETVAANDISSYSMDLISCMGSTCVWWIQEHSFIFLQVVNNLRSLFFFLRPLDCHRSIVAQLQLFLFLFRLCLCDLAWLIFHATALRKYLSTSSTVKTSSTSTYDTILWDHVEQEVLTPFAGLQRIIFLLRLEFCTCAYRDKGKGVYCLFLWDVKRLIFRKL